MNRPAIVITGSRLWDRPNLLAEVIDEELQGFAYWHKEYPTFYHGACPTGADKMADDYIRELERYSVVTFHADWNHFGKYAGPKRNEDMIRHVTQFHDLDKIAVLAFFKKGSPNAGTTNCVATALANGIEDKYIRRTWA